MSRLRIGDKRARKKYRPDKPRELTGDRPIETEGEARAEDAVRAKGARKAAIDPKGLFKKKAAKALADRLEYGGEDPPPKTLASALYWREQRLNVAGDLTRITIEGECQPVTVATLIPRGESVRPEDLMKQDPRKWMRRLRSDLNRLAKKLGIKITYGWLTACLHGEFEPNSGMLILHYHLAVAGQHIDLLDKLRAEPKYVANQAAFDDGEECVLNRIVIAREPLTNIGSTMAYRAQGAWFCRWAGDGDDGQRDRERKKRRIPEPYHALVLLWLDRWRLQDLTLLMGLEQRRDGLFLTKTRTPIGDTDV